MIKSITDRITVVQAMQLFQLFRQGTVILSSIVVTKSTLSTREIGLYETLLFIGTSLSFFWVNGLLQGVAAAFARQDEEKRHQFLFNLGVLFAVFSMLTAGIMVVFEPWIVQAMSSTDHIAYYGLFALFMLFNLPSYVVEYVYLTKERPWHIIVWGAITAIAQVLALWLPLMNGGGLESCFYALIGVGILKSVFTVWVCLSEGAARLDAAMIRQFVWFCFPLMLNCILANAIGLFDNWLVNWHFKDPAVFAIFRYGSREFPLAIALTSAVGTAMVLPIATNLNEGMATLKKRGTRLMHVLFPISIVLLFCSNYLFEGVFNPEFVPAAAIFNIYLLVLTSRILLPSSVLMALGDTRAILWSSVTELGVKIITGFWFVNLWGLEGLAWSVVISYFVEKAMNIIILYKHHNIRLSEWLDLKVYVWYSLILLAVGILR